LIAFRPAATHAYVQAASRGQAYRDRVLQGRLVAGGQAPPRFDLVSIGVWEYHPTPSLSDMWIDDVRVSSQRIGCGS
jgi:hypothetical protein